MCLGWVAGHKALPAQRNGILNYFGSAPAARLCTAEAAAEFKPPRIASSRAAGPARLPGTFPYNNTPTPDGIAG